MSDVDPGASFVFEVWADYDTIAIPCVLDGDEFGCALQLEGTNLVDEVEIYGRWSPQSRADVLWAMVRTCTREEDWCNEHGPSHNCGFAEHLVLEPVE